MPEPSLSYNPASKITLPGVGAVELQGLIVVVGPNSSGKTQFLLDIRGATAGSDRKSVVCQGIELNAPQDIDLFLAGLEESRCVKRQDGTQGATFTAASSVLGTSDKLDVPSVRYGDVVAWQRDFAKRANEFMRFFGKLLVTTLFLPTRLDTTNQCQSFNHQKESPKNDLQALHVTQLGQEQLNTEIVRAFGKSMAIDSSTPNLCVKVFDTPEQTPPRCWPDDTNGMPIEREGDGLRSFAAICVSLLAGHRPVCIIDEPESCLHPPQARALGQLIGRRGSSKSRTTLVATHSSQVLRGVIETANSVQIIRLTQVKRKFSAHMIDYQVLMESINKPMVRAETVLDGVFADGVLVVEGDGDRAVYGAALSAATTDGRFDVHFVPAGGHGSIPSVATFYRRLKIPVAVIADLDLVLEHAHLGKLLTGLAPHQPEPINSIVGLCVQVSDQIMKIPPPIDRAELRVELSALIENPNWEQGDNTALMRLLRETANKLDRSKVLKSGGLSGLNGHDETKQLLTQIVDACRPLGLFLVPVGELECWAPELMAGVGKQKAEWANQAALRIQKEPRRANDIIEFVKTIAAFLEADRDSSGPLG